MMKENQAAKCKIYTLVTNWIISKFMTRYSYGLNIDDRLLDIR